MEKIRLYAKGKKMQIEWSDAYQKTFNTEQSDRNKQS